MYDKIYQRCEFIIRQFMSVESSTAKQLSMFNDWLLNGRHCREKNLAIRKLFFEALPDINTAHPHKEKEEEKQCDYQGGKVPSS